MSIYRQVVLILTMSLGIPVLGFAQDATVSYLTEGNDGAAMQRVRFQIKGNALRFSVLGGLAGGSSNDYYLYSHGAGRIRYVQPDTRAYYDIGPGMMDDAVNSLDVQRQRLQEMLDTTLANAGETEKEAVRNALETLEQASENVREFMSRNQDTSVATLGGVVGELTLDGMDCTIHKVILYQTEMEVCFVRPEQLQLEDSEVAVLQGFQQTLTETTGAVNLYSLVPGQLPLVAVYGSLDAPQGITTRFDGLSREDLPNSLFGLPSNYTARTPDSAPGRTGR